MRELDPKWTDGQRSAIRMRGETMLVSAAAGSGKTAVLTERIIDRLLDEENALELSSVLVVTFTKAAAAELKSRIRKALDTELARNPDNHRLQTQLLAVGGAKICTIDSYCLDLIRSHFDILGLSPRVSVMDEAQAALLSKTVMNTLIDDYFDGNIVDASEKIDDFGAFTDLFVTTKTSETLADIFIKIRTTLNTFEEGTVSWLCAHTSVLRKFSDIDFLSHENPLGAQLRRILDTLIQTWTPEYEAMVSFLDTDAVYQKNYGECFLYERDFLTGLSKLMQEGLGYDAIRSYLHSFAAPRMRSGVRGDKVTEESIYYKDRHKVFQEHLKEIKGRYFSMSGAQVTDVCLMQAKVTESLGVFLSVFERRLSEEKRRRGVLDFDDIGRMALQLLWDAENECQTPLARAESKRYSEIFIDEYQDVNPVQDRIFASIAGEDNRFMVGDAKQSIYGFRGAIPELFMDYRCAFEKDPVKGSVIFLSENFRCDSHIIAFANDIFSVLFGTSGRIPYTDADAFRFAKPVTGEDTQTSVSLALIDADPADDTEDEPSDEGTDAAYDSSDDDAEDTAGGSEFTEAEYIADKIAYLIKYGRKRDGSKVMPRDIAVLVRSAKTSSAPIAEALDRKKIPNYNNVSHAFFENAEVLLMYSLLSVIDNPQKDVYLAGAMKSPIYRITLDEMIYIRKTYPDGSLYDALCAFCAERDFVRGRYFLEKLAYYRHLSEGMPVDRFLWFLYQDTGILSLVYEKENAEQLGGEDRADGVQMRANLMMLYEYARSFESGTFQGLYEFVLFIENVMQEKARMPAVMLSGEDADTVRIMTVHQSKGLEFPICFYAGLGKRFNDNDLKKTVLIDKDAGLATYLRDETGFARVNHPYRECIRATVMEKQRYEEMRVLYVALTRAREQLYLSASVRAPQKYVSSFASSAVGGVSVGALLKASSPLAWILLARAYVTRANGEPMMSLTVTYPEKVSEQTQIQAEEQRFDFSGTAEPCGDTLSYRAAKKIIDTRFSFVYPDEEDTKIPAKITVSDLVRLKQTEDEASDASAQISTEAYARPRFLSESGGETIATPAQKGTATHLFLQYCDFDALSAEGPLDVDERVEREIARLCERHYITVETADMIERETLMRFFKSELFKRLICAQTVRREVRFNLQIPAYRVMTQTQNHDRKILVQGIIDCYYVDEQGKVILVDYKTDHFPERMLADPVSIERILRQRHAEQLLLYKEACEQMLCTRIDDVRIYSFALGNDFSLNL